MRRVAAIAVASGVFVAACEARVSDPVGDGTGTGTIDIVKAGVDYQTITTRLWITFADPNASPPPKEVGWDTSGDGDKIADGRVDFRLAATARGGEEGRWTVLVTPPGGGELVERCSAIEDVDRAFTEATVTLEFNSRCLATPANVTAIPDSLRVRAFATNVDDPIGGADDTDWTAAALPS